MISMRRQDLIRVWDHVFYHQAKERKDAMRGDIGWAYIKFAAWAFPRLALSGWFWFDEGRPVPGGAACNKKDVA